MNNVKLRKSIYKESFLTPENQMEIDFEQDELNDRMPNNSYDVFPEDIDNDDKELLYGNTDLEDENPILENRKRFNNKLSNKPESLNEVILKEGSILHFDSITQLSQQIEKFILKHKENPNAIINDFSIGLFVGFGNAFAKDNDDDTNGLNMLSKTIQKLKELMRVHENLVPKEGSDFVLDNDTAEEMEDTLQDSNEDESEDDENLEEEVMVSTDLPNDITSDRKSKDLKEFNRAKKFNYRNRLKKRPLIMGR